MLQAAEHDRDGRPYSTRSILECPEAAAGVTSFFARIRSRVGLVAGSIQATPPALEPLYENHRSLDQFRRNDFGEDSAVV